MPGVPIPIPEGALDPDLREQMRTSGQVLMDTLAELETRAITDNMTFGEIVSAFETGLTAIASDVNAYRDANYRQWENLGEAYKKAGFGQEPATAPPTEAWLAARDAYNARLETDGN
jgi:hypothetical protein